LSEARLHRIDRVLRHGRRIRGVGHAHRLDVDRHRPRGVIDRQNPARRLTDDPDEIAHAE
jgi:hypothetical protein